MPNCNFGANESGKSPARRRVPTTVAQQRTLEQPRCRRMAQAEAAQDNTFARTKGISVLGRGGVDGKAVGER